jgi:hypothetical protein
MMMATASTAAAEGFDPAVVVNMGGYMTQAGVDFFTLVGPTVSFHQTSGVIPPKLFATTCAPCVAGDTVNMSFRHPPLDPNDFTRSVDLGTGFGHTLGHPDDVDLAFSGSLKFMATPLLFPDVTSPFVTLETPFTFRGWLSGLFISGPNAGSGGFGARLKGSGIATWSFARNGDVYQAIGRPNFKLQASTPEPSTLLLLTAAIPAIRRRLRQKH